jgi:hypothetical protein
VKRHYSTDSPRNDVSPYIPQKLTELAVQPFERWRPGCIFGRPLPFGHNVSAGNSSQFGESLAESYGF